MPLRIFFLFILCIHLTIRQVSYMYTTPQPSRSLKRIKSVKRVRHMKGLTCFTSCFYLFLVQASVSRMRAERSTLFLMSKDMKRWRRSGTRQGVGPCHSPSCEWWPSCATARSCSAMDSLTTPLTPPPPPLTRIPIPTHTLTHILTQRATWMCNRWLGPGVFFTARMSYNVVSIKVFNHPYRLFYLVTIVQYCIKLFLFYLDLIQLFRIQ